MAQSNVIELALIGSQQGQPWAHVTHWSARSANVTPTPQSVDNLRDAYYTVWKAQVLPLLSIATNVKLVTATMLGPTYIDPDFPLDNKISVIYQSAPSAVNDLGGEAGDPLNQFSAFYVRTRTGNALRRYKGSMHLPGVAENTATGQFVKAATVTALQLAINITYIADYTVTIGAVTWVFRYGVLSKRYLLLNATGSKPWDYTEDALTATVSPRVGSLTRRKSKQSP